MTARPLRRDAEVLDALVPVAGRDVLDVGCGDGGLVRRLCARGARAIGVEVSEAALARARGADPDHPERYRVGAAPELPFADASFDVALLMLSLHHVPAASMRAALADVRRLLRPDGLAYVAEPLPEGALFALVRRVDDETEVRALAQAALAAAPEVGLHRARTLEYEVLVPVPGIAHLRERIVGVDPGRAATFDAEAPALERDLAALRERDGDGWSLRQPIRVDVLRPAAAAAAG